MAKTRKTYVVARGNTLSYENGKYANEGEPVPAVVSDAEIVRLEAQGVIVGFVDFVKSARPQEPGAKPGVGSRWDLDPATLRGKKIDELNVMVLERDPAVKPFDTEKEAIAQLSMGFVKKPKTADPVSDDEGEASQLATS